MEKTKMCSFCNQSPVVSWNLCRECMNKGRDLMDGKLQRKPKIMKQDEGKINL